MASAQPIVLSLQICDGVHFDPVSGKAYILGRFSSLSDGPIPRPYPLIHVTLELTNGHGRTRIDIRLVRNLPDRLEDQVLASTFVDVDFESPRDEVEFGVDFVRVEFPALGGYRVLVECQGNVLLERKLVVE